jgi:hypothetical protein
VPGAIGPIERLAPSPGAGPGRVVGLRSALNFAADAASGLAEALPLLRGHDDAPEGQIMGNAGGKLVVHGVPGRPGGFQGATSDLGDVAGV